MYQVQRTQFEYNAIGDPCLTRDQLLSEEYGSPEDAHHAAVRFAEAWIKDAWLIQHHPGQSVMFFKWGYVEFTRTSFSAV
jgi:hypothetical protein